MISPRFLIFIPVPLRPRIDGWSPELQLAFVRMLAAGARPSEAARALGKNRQTAYALRARTGAASFAAAWDLAALEGRKARAARPRPKQSFGPAGKRQFADRASECFSSKGYEKSEKSALGCRFPRTLI